MPEAITRFSWEETHTACCGTERREYAIEGPDRLVIDLAGVRYPFLAWSPAREYADQAVQALAELIPWLEDYAQMRDDENVPACVSKAREILGMIQAKTIPPEQVNRERELAPEMLKTMRRVVLAHAMMGEVPDPVILEAAKLVEQVCEPARTENSHGARAGTS
jgi:hypothetical protein